MEEAEIRTDKTMVTLPSARRIMKATMIGTIDGEEFTQGIGLFPVLDSPVLVATKSDLEAIFGKKEHISKPPEPEKPGYCIPIGESVVFPDYQIKINPDVFFGKHSAIIGSTGSGKSCTIATIIQSIILNKEVKSTRFIILDTNGEYRTAFQREKQNDEWEDDDPRFRCLYIPTDPVKTKDKLVIPYWFMNSDDFVRLFRAKEGLQAPVLLRALRLSRSKIAGKPGILTTIEVLRISCTQIMAHTQNDTPTQQWAIAKNIYECCEDSLRYREVFPENVKNLDKAYGTDFFLDYENAIKQIQKIAQEVYAPDGKKTNQSLGATRIQQIQNFINPVIDALNKKITNEPTGVPEVSSDQPIFFDCHSFLERSLETAMREEAESGSPGRIRDACGPMFLRIRRFFEDPRFKFLFGQFPNAIYVLASFLRDILGLLPGDNNLSSYENVKKEVLPFYDRQRSNIEKSFNVVVIDLSLLAAEVLENVTALIGRLILEFLQRLGDKNISGFDRGSFPVVLVLEEAQNYIRESRGIEEKSISREVFERIAREGRKYGLGLVVASQRPSELSKTVLSQCNSFIVHRLQNPEDLKYFREIVPGIYDQLLNQLPALAPRHALILGESVQAPALVYMRESNPIPRSKDPKFYKQWVADKPEMPNVEAICHKWEGKDSQKKES